MTNTVLTMKQIELLNEVLPSGKSIAIISDPNTEADDLEKNARHAEQTLGRRLIIVYAASENEFDAALLRVATEGSAGLVVPDRPLFVSRHNQIASLVARQAIPTIYPPANLIASGGLMSYGASTFDMFRRAGVFVGKILKGANPSELPVEQPTKIELKINLKTAKTLRLEIPPTLLARAVVAELSHATGDLLKFGCRRAGAGESVRHRANSPGRRSECDQVCRTGRHSPTRSATDANRSPFSFPRPHHIRCPGFVIDGGRRCELGRGDLS